MKQAAAYDCREVAGEPGNASVAGEGMGFLEEVVAPSALGLSTELGAASLQPASLLDAVAQWQSQQEEWMSAAHRNLRPGGSLTIMVGNGDALEENANEIDCLASTLSAAAAVNFRVADPLRLSGHTLAVPYVGLFVC